MKIQIIGMGEIGTAIYQDMKKLDDENTYLAVDKYPKQEWISEKIKEANVYIISVYTTEQVFEVLNKIPLNNGPLISIESTVSSDKLEELKNWCELHKDKCFVILFPHRYNPNDPEHRCFNLNRIMGGYTTEALGLGKIFWEVFMEDDFQIIPVSFEIAALSKVVENAHRYLEIAWAENLKMECNRYGINFEELREAVNTKWNINIKEARDGIGGKCLPKDANLLLDYMPKLKMLKQAIETNEEYKYGRN